jgi:hypothetical protein
MKQREVISRLWRSLWCLRGEMFRRRVMFARHQKAKRQGSTNKICCSIGDLSGQVPHIQRKSIKVAAGKRPSFLTPESGIDLPRHYWSAGAGADSSSSSSRISVTTSPTASDAAPRPTARSRLPLKPLNISALAEAAKPM